MFQPRLRNLRRSTSTAWNQHMAKSSFLYLWGLPHDSNLSSERLLTSRVMLALSPLGGSVVILMARCRMPIGNLGLGDDESHRRNCWCGARVGSDSMILSSSPSHDSIRWQLASSTQLPSAMPASIILMASGAWPWPSAIELKGIALASESCASWLVGSTPGERTKMSGSDWCESSSTALRSSTGGSVYFWPRLLTMKAVVAKMMRSGRRQRTMISRCSSVHLFSHSPGSRAADVSGSGWRYHSRHSRADCSKEARMLRKLGSLSSSVMWSHEVSPIQSEHGLGGCCDLSKTCPPRRKKSYSPMSILPAPCRILAQIWKAKSSLCASKSARHVERYTKYVWYSLSERMRSCRSSERADFSSDVLKSATYASSENWYIGSTRARSASRK
mmetsp:Transcript_29514/g.76185  ORF Transcript_29514/g.76185 Transcript_29514/m.76185 type:complete len:388 (-) Transcript_29514:680-1843(-)